MSDLRSGVTKPAKIDLKVSTFRPENLKKVTRVPEIPPGGDKDSNGSHRTEVLVTFHALLELSLIHISEPTRPY